jgi:hypothetical protein
MVFPVPCTFTAGEGTVVPEVPSSSSEQQRRCFLTLV